MEPRPVLATVALDDPRASVNREVRDYLSVVAAAHARLRDAIADATGVLSDEHSQLAGAAALQVRLTQRFLDAQRAVLALWADTDAKVARVVETAGLEAAMLGLDIDGRVTVGRFVVPDIEPRLQALLEAWWSETHRAGDQAIERAHTQATQWVEVAQLVAADPRDADAPDAPDTADAPDAPDTSDTSVGAAVERQEAVEPTTAHARLPVALHDALTDASHHDLEVLLVSMLDALEDPLVDEAATPVDQAEDATHAPERGIAPDGFDLFWGSGRAGVSSAQRRSVVIDAIVPMGVVTVILVAVLAWIG